MTIDHLFTREPWPHQRAGVERTIAALNNAAKSVCLTAPTGSGKTNMMIALAKWEAEERGGMVLCLTNRILLTEQTRDVFQGDGIGVGVISSSMKWAEREEAQVQIATIQTILARRRTDSSYWAHAALVLADEVHQLATGESADLLNEYKERGAKVCGFTATPLGVSNVCDELIVAARTRDLQDAGILCFTRWFAPSELDTRKLVKGKVSLELSENEARRTWGPLKGDDVIRTRIVGNILMHYRAFHPGQTHTLAFAPGVKESLWAAQYCSSMGIPSMHVDGKDFWVHGKHAALEGLDKKTGEVCDRKQDKQRFEAARKEWREGKIKILWNRFVLREGIDEPQIKCIILATPVPSYRSFMQMVGRGLRTHESKDECLVIDHGGNWWRHGSVNVNVDWESVFDCPDPDVLSKNRIAKVRETGESLGQVCPNCGMAHKPYSRMVYCQYCNHKMALGKASRPILQADGTLTQVTGEPIKQWKMHQAPGDDMLWEGLYHNGVKKGHKFSELYQQFFYKKAVQFGSQTRPNFQAAYHPPRRLRFMPRQPNDWWREASMVPREDLY